jgi:UDP-3-O-[3-hydroxymyristoyl] glucosamine N-acyltransferase
VDHSNWGLLEDGPVSRVLKLSELAELVGGQVRGIDSVLIRGVSGVSEAGPDQITWVGHDKYAKKLADSKAGAVVVSPDVGPTPMPAIVVDQPGRAIIKVLTAFAPPQCAPPAGVDSSACVDRTACLGEDVAIGPNVVVGPRCRIGDGTVVHANVSIGAETEVGSDCLFWPGVVVRERCRVGDRVILHPNVTIGSDGYGYELLDGRFEKIPQIGTVVIEDDVEIGAGSCVDRAKFGETIIGRGTKIDNLVQVAHNVHIGPHCIIVAQVAIGGSARLGAYVMLAGKVGVRDHVRLGDRVRATVSCCIFKDIPAGATVSGIPAVDNRQYLREQAMVRRLPRMAEQLRELSQRVARLEQAADD